MEWQPIETAPKDGTEFLAYYPVDGGDPSSFMEVTFGRNLTFGGAEPTHWMPLPAPPKVT